MKHHRLTSPQDLRPAILNHPSPGANASTGQQSQNCRLVIARCLLKIINQATTFGAIFHLRIMGSPCGWASHWHPIQPGAQPGAIAGAPLASKPQDSQVRHQQHSKRTQQCRNKPGLLHFNHSHVSVITTVTSLDQHSPTPDQRHRRGCIGSGFRL